MVADCNLAARLKCVRLLGLTASMSASSHYITRCLSWDFLPCVETCSWLTSSCHVLQVANHMLGTRISKRSGNEDITVIMDDSGEDSPHGSGSDVSETDTSRHRLLDGNQASDSSDLMAAELEAVKAGRSAPLRGSSLRQSVQADGTVRLGPGGFSAKQADKQQAVEMSDMPLNPESRTTSSLGLGVTPSSSHQDLSQVQQRQQHGDSPQQNGRSRSRMMPSSSSFDDFGDQRRQSPGPSQNGSSVPPSPFATAPHPSPFMTTVQQHRAIPDPAAPADSPPEGEHPLDRSHSMHSGRITRWWGRFDAQYMQPVFGGPSPATPAAAASNSGPPAIFDPNAPVEARPRT